MQQIIMAVGVVLIAGILGGLLGVGGGILMVPAFIYIFKWDPKVAFATSLCLIVPSALTGSIKQIMQGTPNLKLVACAALFAIAGGWIGASLSPYFSSDTLKRIFGGILLIVGFRMLLFK